MKYIALYDLVLSTFSLAGLALGMPVSADVLAVCG